MSSRHVFGESLDGNFVRHVNDVRGDIGPLGGKRRRSLRQSRFVNVCQRHHGSALREPLRQRPADTGPCTSHYRHAVMEKPH
jgi:hypothetical protein